MEPVALQGGIGLQGGLQGGLQAYLQSLAQEVQREGGAQVNVALPPSQPESEGMFSHGSDLQPF